MRVPSKINVVAGTGCGQLGTVEIIAAALCDFASDYGGKLCIMGAFDTIMAPVYPASHAQCCVAVRLIFRDEDTGFHLLEVLLIDSDGRPFLPPEHPKIEFEVFPLPPEVYFLSRNFIVNFHGLPLPSPGQFEIQIRLNGKVSKSLPLQCVLAPAPPPIENN